MRPMESETVLVLPPRHVLSTVSPAVGDLTSYVGASQSGGLSDLVSAVVQAAQSSGSGQNGAVAQNVNSPGALASAYS